MEGETWPELKARLLAAGKTRLFGEDTEPYISRSSAGPGAGGKGSVFFSLDSHRVRLALSDDGPVTIRHTGNGQALLTIDGKEIVGTLERPALHCPRQAFITISVKTVI